jgi:CheY-like chemotaxis protein
MDAVLYAEDDEMDVIFMRRAWQRAGLDNPLHVVNDGREAEEYLSARPIPSLVLLDLHLPMTTGLDILKWIREQPPLRTLRVILFTSSKLPSHMQRAEALGATTYWVKPSDPRKLEEMLLSLRQLGL